MLNIVLHSSEKYILMVVKITTKNANEPMHPYIYFIYITHEYLNIKYLFLKIFETIHAGICFLLLKTMSKARLIGKNSTEHLQNTHISG